MGEKPNPLLLKRPKRAVRELCMTDSSHPGLEVKMKLRALDALDVTNVNVLFKELSKKYLSEEYPFPAIDGEVPVLNEDILQATAAIYISQCGPDEDKFTPEEIIAFSVTTPEVWLQMMDAVSGLSVDSVWGKALGMIQTPAGSS